MEAVAIHRGDSPIILCMPHTGTYLPEEVEACLNKTGKALSDTDWHIHTLYQDLLPSATTLRATFHRYVIDANRAPSNQSLYPGQNTTGLCPLTDFAGKPLYLEGCEPDKAEIERRRLAFHAQYHKAIALEIERVKAAYGFVILYDCHSIRSHLPFLFDGVLPDFNIGSNAGRSCAATIENTLSQQCKLAKAYSTVVNGRFKGGWTTRYYGQPDAHVHCIQMELAQSSYMQETPPWHYQADKAKKLRTHLQAMLEALDALARSGTAL